MTRDAPAVQLLARTLSAWICSSVLCADLLAFLLDAPEEGSSVFTTPSSAAALVLNR